MANNCKNLTPGPLFNLIPPLHFMAISNWLYIKCQGSLWVIKLLNVIFFSSSRI